MNVQQSIPGFGEEAETIKFNGIGDWFVSYTDVAAHWRAQPTYFIAEVVFLIGGLVTFLHALNRGGRFVHLWIGIFLHGLVVEVISNFHPDIDNFWHSLTPIVFLGRRLPLHILFLYPAFLYTASIAADRLKTPRWSEPFTVGLMVVLIDIPYDIMSIKFLHWTWHDTDPNIYDRHYYVPWNSYYFHSTFAANFTFLFHITRKIIAKSSDKWTLNKSCTREWLCTLLTALFSMPGGVLLFIPIYHPLHHIYGIHSEVTFFVIFVIFLVLAWSGERSSHSDTKVFSDRKIDYILLVFLIPHYSIYLGMALFGDPSKEIAIGLHEPIGPCNETVAIRSPIGQTLYKRKYLCVEDNDETYFGWACLPKGEPPREGSYWYTACGTPMTNRAEYITVISTICIAAIGVFTNAFLLSRRITDLESHRSMKREKKIK